MDAKARPQAFGDLRSLPIALPTKAKASSCALLNEILADTMILYALYKKPTGWSPAPTFYQLHLLFDKHAEEQLEIVDLSPSVSRASAGSASVTRAMRPN